jgi:hypothetical protein
MIKQLKMHRNKVCHISLRVMMKERLKKQRVGMNYKLRYTHKCDLV